MIAARSEEGVERVSRSYGRLQRGAYVVHVQKIRGKGGSYTSKPRSRAIPQCIVHCERRKESKVDYSGRCRSVSSGCVREVDTSYRRSAQDRTETSDNIFTEFSHPQTRFRRWMNRFYASHHQWAKPLGDSEPQPLARFEL